MEENHKNQGENEFEKEDEQDLETEFENENESEEENAAEVLMDTDTVVEFMMQKFLDPDIELSEEAEAELYELLKSDPELFHLNEIFRLGPASGEALGNAKGLLEEMESLAETMRDFYPGYAGMDWMDIAADVANVYPQKTMLQTELRVNEMTIGIWHQDNEGELFHEATLEDLRMGDPASILTIYMEDGILHVEYYCPGMFSERPSLVLKKKGDPDDLAYSVMLDAEARMEGAGGKMLYEGFEDDMEDGIYEIEFMTDFRE